MPGGQLDELHSLETHGEALKLASRFLWHVARSPEVVGERVRAQRSAGAPKGPSAPADEPLHSTLAYRCVTSVEGT